MAWNSSWSGKINKKKSENLPKGANLIKSEIKLLTIAHKWHEEIFKKGHKMVKMKRNINKKV